MIKYFILLFILFFYNGSYAYVIPENEVKEIETQDNEICLARGINYNTEFGIVFYWNCRKQLINERIKNSKSLKGKNKFYITELKRIRKVIDNIITRIESDFTTKLNNYLDEKEFYSIELRGKDKYYYNLLTFLNYDYPLLNINTKKEINDIIETRKKLNYKKESLDIKKNLEKFPQCIRYNLKSKEFNECINFYLSVENCKIAVINKMNERENLNRINCKKQSIEKYPDHMVLYNSEYMDLKNEKIDEFNIDRDKQKQKEKRLAELNKLISGPRLSKNQLINLRKFEEKKCLMDKDLENNLFKISIGNECENMLNKGFKI